MAKILTRQEAYNIGGSGSLSEPTRGCTKKIAISYGCKADGSYLSNQLISSASAASGELGDDEYQDITHSPTYRNYVINTGRSGAWPSLKAYFETEKGRTGWFSLPGGSASSNSQVKRYVDYRVAIGDNLARIYKVTQGDGTDFTGFSYCSSTVNDASDVPADRWVGAPSEKNYKEYGHAVYGDYWWKFKCTVHS